MAGIAGIARPGARADVAKMLSRLGHRGPAGSEIIETGIATLGVVYGASETQIVEDMRQRNLVRDGEGRSRWAEARYADGRLTLKRDALGVAPLYYSRLNDGALCFASEVKALLPFTGQIEEFPPGSFYDGMQIQTYFRLTEQTPLLASPDHIAQELHRRLDAAVGRCIGDGCVGAWLSGGLDSSTIAALARRRIDRLHTFAAGLPGAPDLAYAAEVAAFIASEHHEVVVTPAQILTVLPKVIYHLESFDALLVRSSIMNYLVAQAAADDVPAVLSGEGGDELFAGYEYLKSLNPALLPAELIDIIGRLHNTALQRVDRCAAAHGMIAYVPFLDPDVVEYALQIPVEFKLHQGVEKWILRRALDGMLPESVLTRTKAKFWEGAGIGDLLADYAEEQVSDADFRAERILPNGWRLNTKEELLYYRIFHDHFGDLDNMTWMGRTKGAPVDA